MDALSECEVAWGFSHQGGGRKAILRAGMRLPNRWGCPGLGGVVCGIMREGEGNDHRQSMLGCLNEIMID